MRLSQTSIIAASLILAYIVFITVRGELPAFLAVFTGDAVVGTASAGTTGGINLPSIPGAPTITLPAVPGLPTITIGGK